MLTESERIPAKPECELSEHGAPLRVPAHGVGKLQVGNPKATGRPKRAIRERALSGADRLAIPILERIATDENSPPEHKIRAAELLLRYGLGTQDEVQMVNAEQVLTEFAKVAASLGIEKDIAGLIVERGLESLGVSK